MKLENNARWELRADAGDNLQVPDTQTTQTES